MVFILYYLQIDIIYKFIDFNSLIEGVQIFEELKKRLI